MSIVNIPKTSIPLILFTISVVNMLLMHNKKHICIHLRSVYNTASSYLISCFTSLDAKKKVTVAPQQQQQQQNISTKWAAFHQRKIFKWWMLKNIEWLCWNIWFFSALRFFSYIGFIDQTNLT